MRTSIHCCVLSLPKCTSIVVSGSVRLATPVSYTGWLYGNRHQFFIQLFAAMTIIVYDALMTFIILRIIKWITPLRMPEDELEIGDLAIHDEEAYPPDEGYTRVDMLASVGAPGSGDDGPPTAQSSSESLAGDAR